MPLDEPPESAALRDHWWPRPGWRPGRITYTWHLTFDGADQVHRLAADLQQRLGRLPGLDPIPARWLHLSLQAVGWQDEIRATALHEVIDAVQGRVAKIPAFDLTFSHPTMLAEAIALVPEPVEPVHQLYDEIRSGITDAIGAERLPQSTFVFLPHVSLAYSRINSSAKPYRAALDAEPIEPATVRVSDVTLIRQERVLEPEWVYRWQTETTAPLA